jgi:hypothetical protein
MSKESKLEATLEARLASARSQNLRQTEAKCIDDLQALWVDKWILLSHFHHQYSWPTSLKPQIEKILEKSRKNASVENLETEFKRLSTIVQEAEHDLNLKLGGEIQQTQTTIEQLIQIAKILKARIPDQELASYVESLPNRYRFEPTKTLRAIRKQMEDDGSRFQVGIVKLRKVITARLKIPLSRSLLTNLLSAQGIPLLKLSAADLTHLSESQLRSRLRLVLTNPQDVS